MQTDALVITCDENAIANLIEYCRTRRIQRLMLVADENTYAALGWRVESGLQEQDWDVRTAILAGDKVITTDGRIFEVLRQANGEARTYLAVGSGTVTDVTRYASFCSRNDFISMPTAPSVDAYTSGSSAVVLDGFKTTIQCQAPVAIFADVQTLCKAPREMIAAGYGDFVGKYISLADWRLGQLLLDERYSDAIAQRLQTALEDCVAHTAEIGEASPTGITKLLSGLFESGLCMADFGDSRPASGAEHLCSHFCTAKQAQEGRPDTLHGIAVGIGTVLAAEQYEAVGRLTQDEVTARLADAVWPDRGTQIEHIRTVYGPIADRIVANHTPFMEMMEAQFDTVKQRIGDQWPEIRAIAASVPPAKEITRLLETVGGPSDLQSLGLTEDELQQMQSASHYLRSRLTIVTLGQVLGLWK